MKYLLAKSHSYVLLGKIAIDPLERAFCKLRQSGGSTYFVNNQQVLEKFNISKTKLMLRCNIDLPLLLHKMNIFVRNVPIRY